MRHPHFFGKFRGRAETRGQDDLSQRLAQRQLLEQGLASLGREAIHLVDVEQLSIGEAAEVLAISPQALKSRVHRARLRLLAALRKEDHDGR